MKTRRARRRGRVQFGYVVELAVEGNRVSPAGQRADQRAAIPTGYESHAAAGDAIVVPADAEFELANAGAGPLRLLCCLPVGGQACLPNSSTFTPPWAQ